MMLSRVAPVWLLLGLGFICQQPVDANVTIEPDSPVLKEKANMKTCENEPADIVFLLDESGSVGTQNFHDILTFIQTWVQHFEIGPKHSDVQVSLVKFSKTVDEVFALNAIRDKQKLLTTLAEVPYKPGKATKTGQALEFLRTKSFSVAHGARDGVPGVGVLITDGRSWYKKKTLTQAKLAKEAGLILLVIGIGRKVDSTELDAIASEPVEDHSLLVKDMATLKVLGEYISNLTCSDVNQANREEHFPHINMSTTTVQPTTIADLNTTHAYNLTELPEKLGNETTHHWYTHFPIHPALIIMVIIAVGGLIMTICAVVATCSKKPDDKKPLLSS